MNTLMDTFYSTRNME